MTEAEWFACTDPRPPFEFLRADRGEARRKGGRRKLRLFACACLRGIWPLLRKTASRRAVEVAEQFADGLAGEHELAEAYRAARSALANESSELGKSPYWQSAEAAVHVAARAFDGGDHPSVAHAAVSAATAWALDRAGPRQGADYSRRFPRQKQARQAAHADWLRDVFGNPFRPVTADPGWRTPDVLALAKAAYDERTLPAGTPEPARLAVLADALEEAGCACAELLGHLRSRGPHVRGCWALDLLLGKD
jgi:hypothetical protein